VQRLGIFGVASHGVIDARADLTQLLPTEHDPEFEAEAEALLREWSTQTGEH